MAAVDEPNPMAEAEAQLYRRIQDLRARARGEEQTPTEMPEPMTQAATGMPDLRTLLSRAEQHVGELRTTASELERNLPARIEHAVERALDDHTSSRRLGELRDLLTDVAGRVEQLNRDILAERLGRVEDLELVVELISQGMAALRQDVADVAGAVDRATGGVDAVIEKLDQPMQVTLERPRQGGVRDLFRPTESESATPAGTHSPGSAS
jgi:chromosome segregation ATPase